MEDNGAFSTQALWRPSIFTLNSNTEDSIFEGLRLNDISSIAPKEPGGDLFHGLSDEFDLPPLDDVSIQNEFEQNFTPDLGAEPLHDEHHDSQLAEHDVWDFDLEPPQKLAGPRLYTWEAFQLKDDQPPPPVYFSEAGDGAFNAVQQQREQSAGVIQHDVTLRACCSLVLGRSSVLFRWDSAKRSFVPILQRVSLSGVSLLCSQKLIAQFLETGTIFRELCNFASQTNARDCTAMVAFRRSINAVLDHLEQYLCGQIASVRSLLQLQQVVARPLSILKHIQMLAGTLRRDLVDEELISMLSDEVTALAESGSTLASMMNGILAHVSMPWLQRLSEDVGLSTSLRNNSSLLSSDGVTSTEDEMMPDASFLALEDNRTISSVRRSIRLLRRHVPHHPLVESNSSYQGVQNVQGHDSDAIVRQAEDYRERMSVAVARHRQGFTSFNRSELEPLAEVTPSTADGNDPFALPTLEDSNIFAGNTLNDTSSDINVYHDLQRSLDLIFEGDTGQVSDSSIEEFGDILVPLRPFIDAQASLVNGAVLNYLFNSFKLLDHLELHRSYHLFGNGDFVTRLSTALFSDDVQTAERRRGNIPTSETMGLRLGSRESQRWPPASSELRLTLLNVLSDSYNSSDAQQGDTVQLPGGLSFAIRELTDAEIDRVMDPTSIYALDFLRLQYTPPSPLADIFTPAIVQHYDSIFRTLLVHVRVLHATSQLARLCNKQTHQTSQSTTTLQRFAWKARHLSTTLFSHFTDTVIAESWKNFSAQLNALRPSQTQPQHQTQHHHQHPASLHSITLLHSSCLDDIRSKLFLRQKHARIRSVLEELAGIVIKTTATTVHDLETRVSVAEQESRFDVLSGELRGLVEVLASKPPREQRGGPGSGSGAHLQSVSEAAKGLFVRLNW